MMSIIYVNASFKSAVLISFLAFSSLVLCDEGTEKLAIKIREFQVCLTSNPKEIQNKVCNAYVSWYGDIKELLSCLKNHKFSEVDFNKDKKGDISGVGVSINCKSNRKIFVQINKSEQTGKYSVAGVSEIVY